MCKLATVLIVAALGTLIFAGTGCDGRARHVAVPVLWDESLPEAPPAPLTDGPACEVVDVARIGARVTAVLEASDGALWVGTFDSGLFRFEAAPATTTSLGAVPPSPSPSPPAERGAREGERGDPRPGAGTSTAAIAEIPGLRGRERFVNALAEHDGLVWAATQGGLLALDGDRRVLEVLASDGITALAIAHGRLYAGTARGLFRISVAGGAEPVYATGPSGEPLRVTALAASATRLWIGTASGAYDLPLATLEAPLLARTARWLPLVFGDAPAETNVVTALAAIAGGAVAGTDDGGVVQVGDDGSVRVTRLDDARANEVNPGAAASTTEGTAVVGTQGGGALLVRPRDAGLEVARLGVGRAEVSAVRVAGGRILVGTADGRVVEARCAP